MPIYEYRCSKCGEFEYMQKITDDPLKKCPTCRRKVTKLISNSSFQLKGSGWYMTDYGKSGSSGAPKSESDSSSSDTKSETKSETKSSSKSSKPKDTKAA